jgi:glycine/D-amino acid oxidase-like deaminating enzyme
MGGVRMGSGPEVVIVGGVFTPQDGQVNSAHFRNGILLSLISGELVANWVLGRSQPVDVSPFLPRTRATGATADAT